MAKKSKEFSNLLKIKLDDELEWKDRNQVAFERNKEYLTKPPVLMPPRDRYLLRLYISTGKESIGCALTQKNAAGHEEAMYFLSRVLKDAERCYIAIQ